MNIEKREHHICVNLKFDKKTKTLFVKIKLFDNKLAFIYHISIFTPMYLVLDNRTQIYFKCTCNVKVHL